MLAQEFERDVGAALAAQWESCVDVRSVGNRESVNGTLQPTEPHIMNGRLVGSVLGRDEANERVGSEVIGVLGNAASLAVADLQVRVERRSETGRIDFASDGFACFGREIPEFTWEATDKANELKIQAGL